MKYYRMTQGVGVESTVDYIMREDGALIPCTELNADYRAYLAEKDKEVSDFDYQAEEQRQQTEAAKKAVEEQEEELIQKRIREIAIRELEQEGKLTAEEK